MSDDGNTKNQTAEGKNESGYGSNYEDHAGIEAIAIINCVFNAPLMLISILGNALVLAAIIRTPSIRSTSMIMLSNLAVSDLLIGFIVQPLYIANELTKSSSVPVYNLAQKTGVSLCGVSLCTITAITVDRFMALHYHMRYATLVTKSRVGFALVIIWLSNLVLASFHLWSERAFNLSTTFLTAICLNVATVCYVKIYQIVRRHQSQINAQQQAVQSSNLSSNLNLARMRRSALNIFIFYVVLIFCYLPMFILLVFFEASYKNWKTDWNFAITVVFMNSSINPFLYCWRLRELRSAVVKTSRKMLCKQTGQN